MPFGIVCCVPFGCNINSMLSLKKVSVICVCVYIVSMMRQTQEPKTFRLRIFWDGMLRRICAIPLKRFINNGLSFLCILRMSDCSHDDESITFGR